MAEEKSLIEQIQELKDKATRYDNLKERNETYLRYVAEIEALIHDLKKELAPWTEIKPEKKAYQKTDSEVMPEILDKLSHGVEISSPLLQETYGLKQTTAALIIGKLKTMPNVITRKDGKVLKVVIRKEV